ncbi:hypothetical protein CK203_067358 [Vitis vinifera]|uniref:Uncharacterized protein n=1 Tax=Vitis vinifera TaxID=29760 RepID=A0A438EFP0_VITVI|nr:hypothetical protein CK203_067358 [Vitis vinifera]
MHCLSQCRQYGLQGTPELLQSFRTCTGLTFDVLGDAEVALLEEPFSEIAVFKGSQTLVEIKLLAQMFFSWLLAVQLRLCEGGCDGECLFGGREILYASLISNETIDSLLKRNACGVIWGFTFTLLVCDCHGALSCLLKKANFGGFLSDWRVSGRGREGVEAILGLKVNLEKSELILMRRMENVEELDQEFGCRVGALPSSYLGLPARMRLEQIQRTFLWGGGALEQKPHLVRWAIINSDKNKGGRLNNWEVDLVERFFMRLQRWRVSSDEEDRLVWAREKCGKFYVKAMYKVLELGGPSNFLVVVIWNS